MTFIDNDLGAISQEIPQPSYTTINLNISYHKLRFNVPMKQWVKMCEHINPMYQYGTHKILSSKIMISWYGNISHITGPIFCPLLGVSSDYAQLTTGQVTEITCPAIGQAQPKLTVTKRQKTGPSPLWVDPLVADASMYSTIFTHETIYSCFISFCHFRSQYAVNYNKLNQYMWWAIYGDRTYILLSVYVTCTGNQLCYLPRHNTFFLLLPFLYETQLYLIYLSLRINGHRANGFTTEVAPLTPFYRPSQRGNHSHWYMTEAWHLNTQLVS